MSAEVRQLHHTLIDLVGMMNRPQRDVALIREAGITIDRALFPLLVGIERKGPIGIVELAGLAGRNYTTVSRQVATMERQGLVVRRPSKSDRRVRHVTISTKGRTMTKALDVARERLAERLLAGWTKQDLQTLATLMRRFADDLLAWRG